MDQAEINNWKAIAEKMEANGDTSSWFYLRARAIADGKPDPMPNVSELMPNSIWPTTLPFQLNRWCSAESWVIPADRADLCPDPENADEINQHLVDISELPQSSLKIRTTPLVETHWCWGQKNNLNSEIVSGWSILVIAKPYFDFVFAKHFITFIVAHIIYK